MKNNNYLRMFPECFCKHQLQRKMEERRLRLQEEANRYIPAAHFFKSLYVI